MLEFEDQLVNYVASLKLSHLHDAIYEGGMLAFKKHFQ